MDAANDSVWAVLKDRVTAQQGVPFLQTCRGGLRYIILKARVWLLSTPPTGQQAAVAFMTMFALHVGFPGCSEKHLEAVMVD